MLCALCSGPVKLKEYKNSDGVEHLGSALGQTPSIPYRPFPGPPPESDNAPPLRILPIGQCMHGQGSAAQTTPTSLAQTWA
jgi:hypothetical protein